MFKDMDQKINIHISRASPTSISATQLASLGHILRITVHSFLKNLLISCKTSKSRWQTGIVFCKILTNSWQSLWTIKLWAFFSHDNLRAHKKPQASADKEDSILIRYWKVCVKSHYDLSTLPHTYNIVNSNFLLHQYWISNTHKQDIPIYSNYFPSILDSKQVCPIPNKHNFDQLQWQC